MEDTGHEPEQTIEQEVFWLDGILYLPHYTKPGRFVAPGDDKRAIRPYYREELIAAGATPSVEFLWPRLKPKRQAA